MWVRLEATASFGHHKVIEMIADCSGCVREIVRNIKCKFELLDGYTSEFIALKTPLNVRMIIFFWIDLI